MIYKSYLIEQNIKSIENQNIFLFYGENNGLKKDIKDQLRIQYKDQDILYLLQDEIIKNKNILVNEISNKSLFNEKKIIFIDQTNDRILDIIDEITNPIAKRWIEKETQARSK